MNGVRLLLLQLLLCLVIGFSTPAQARISAETAGPAEMTAQSIPDVRPVPVTLETTGVTMGNAGLLLAYSSRSRFWRGRRRISTRDLITSLTILAIVLVVLYAGKKKSGTHTESQDKSPENKDITENTDNFY